jgi:hypothetical protein
MFYYFEKAVFFIIQHHKDWNYKIFFCILIDSRPNEFQKKKTSKSNSHEWVQSYGRITEKYSLKIRRQRGWY